jgi:hypothetical protein
MDIIFFYFLGIATPEFGVGDPCEAALHDLLTQEHMTILASDVVERDSLVYTMGDGVSKTATLGCRIARRAREQ